MRKCIKKTNRSHKPPIENIFIIITGILIIAIACTLYAFWIWNSDIRDTENQALNVVLAVEARIAVLSIIIIIFSFIALSKKNIDLRDEKRKLSETNKRLSEQEELFRTLYEQSPVGISFGNGDQRIIDANTKFQKIIGKSKEELAETSWASITHPDDIQKDLDNFENFQKGEINGYSLRKRYIRSDGSSIWVNMTVAPLSVGANSNLSHICLVEDISEQIQTELELKESERSNAMLLSNLPGMAYRCNYDRDFNMQFISEGCYPLTGYRPEKFLNNKEISLNELILPEYRKYVWEKWTKALKVKAPFRGEFPIKTASGEVKWVFEQGQGVYNKENEVEAIEGLIIDISERRKREEEINYMSYHDALTGLYNRRFFDEEKLRLDNEDYYPLTVIIGDINGVKFVNSALGHQEGDKLIAKMAQILISSCRDGDVLARTGGDEFSILLPKTGYEEAYSVIRQISKLREEENKLNEEENKLNETFNHSISLGCATKNSKEESFSSIINEAEESMYRHKLLQNKSLHSSIISSMKSSLYEKSQETEEHAQRLIELSKGIGESMNLLEEQLNELELLSTLHDIGKIGISDGILNKPDKLNPSEWEEMKRHPEMGYRIAMSTPELAPIADYILCHHERWDGSGYPQGLKGEDIPLLSRIISIADSYDAMTSDRSYRKAMPKEDALNEIRRNSGSQFDPKIVEIFLGNLVKDA